jgi:hypothetical protein
MRGGEKGDRHGLFQLLCRPDSVRACGRRRNLRRERDAGEDRHAVAGTKDAAVRDDAPGLATLLHHIAERPPLLLRAWVASGLAAHGPHAPWRAPAVVHEVSVGRPAVDALSSEHASGPGTVRRRPANGIGGKQFMCAPTDCRYSSREACLPVEESPGRQPPAAARLCSACCATGILRNALPSCAAHSRIGPIASFPAGGRGTPGKGVCVAGRPHVPTFRTETPDSPFRGRRPISPPLNLR